jgi:hypothetical protein
MKNDEWLPNFLGIGGTRCGSTWLHYNLLKHPEIWLPPIKELHYFDRSPHYDSPSYLATERLSARLLGSEPHNREWRRSASRSIARSLLRNITTLPWKLKYFGGRYNDEWYASLFKPGRDKVRGEITPAYSILSARDVAHVRSLMPRAKIILFLRNPIDRIWSAHCKNFVTESQIREQLALPQLEVRSDFVSIISTWGGVYPKQQMLVEFYDELEVDPGKLLQKVYQFLGVDSSDKYIWPALRARLNASPPKPIPRDLKIALTKKYEAQVEGLSELLGGYATQWLDDARTTLGKRVRSTEAG